MDAVSIENWILPSAYLGVVSKIAWVRPAWSGQIRDGCHRFKIGHTVGEELIRVTCLESYFLSEGIVCREEDLLDAKDVELLVLELGGHDGYAQLKHFACDENNHSHGALPDVAHVINIAREESKAHH